MKKIILTVIGIIGVSIGLKAQTFTTNTTPVGMEHNVLFNANNSSNSINVSQTGSASLNLGILFDGKFGPSYTSIAPTESSPTVILIEGLPNSHTQTGAWVGWSTRYWQSKRFKIEGYDTYNGNIWKVLADYSTQDYNDSANFVTKIHSSGIYRKLRFTFYSGTGTNGRLGVSELFFIHPEAVSPYQGLISSSTVNDLWNVDGANIHYSDGNVGIGTTAPGGKLHINTTNTNGNYNTIFDANSLAFENGGQSSYIRKLDTGKLFFSIGTTSNYVMSLSNNGNVGIGTGTANADEKLTVNGKIHTEEVRVDMTVPGPDYVFEKYFNGESVVKPSYNMPTLKEVEAFTKANHHLPEIPSAQEMQDNGVQLKEMNLKLLQKIEELTLYAIEQDQEIKDLKLLNKKFIELQLRLEKLENKK